MKILGYTCLIHFFQPGTPLRPIVASMHAPVTLISKFVKGSLGTNLFKSDASIYIYQ